MALRKPTESLSENGRISARHITAEVTSPYLLWRDGACLVSCTIQLENSWTDSDYI